MSRRSLRSKFAVAAASALVCGAAAVWIHDRSRRDVDTVRVVDDPQVLRDLLESSRDRPLAADTSSPFARGPLNEEQAGRFFPAVAESEHWRYDPLMFTRRVANDVYRQPFAEHPDGGWDVRTNSLGMREDGEPRDPAPPLRVLFAGDSHVDGVHPNADSIPSRLEAILSSSRGADAVEALNAGQGSHTLHNYAGVWDTFANLAPDVFVVVVYGGNDFGEAARLDRFLRGDGPHATRPYLFEYSRLDEGRRSLLPQELSQEAYFRNNPDDVDRAIALARDFAVRQAATCRDAGARAVFVYLPPPTRAQPELYAASLEACLAQARFDPADLGVSDRIADAWIAGLAEEGLDVVDLRPVIAAHDAPLYWHLDHHLNPAGAQVVAAELAGRLAQGGGGAQDGD